MKLNDVLVLVEHRDNEVNTITPQLLYRGRQLANQLGVELGAVIIGADITEIADKIRDSGVDEVFMAEYSPLARYNPEIFTSVLADIIHKNNPTLSLFGHTFLGMEIGPAVATRLGIPLLSNCLDIELSPEGWPVVVRPMYSGTINVKIESKMPLIIGLQKGAYSGKPVSAKPSSIVSLDIDKDMSSIRTRVLDIIRPRIGEVDLTKSDVIVAVGRGIGQAANLKLARELAQALGGVVAATRPVIDMGWLPPEYQVGLSGTTVNPKVYIACGISGAAQHVAGMIDSQLIIAINKDPDAPIFNVAHYNIVGDIFEVVPNLIVTAAQSS